MDLSGRLQGPTYKHAGSNSAPYELISVRKLTPVIGAEIGDIDLSQPVSAAQFDEVSRALWENQVIFFRGHHLGPQPLCALVMPFAGFGRKHEFRIPAPAHGFEQYQGGGPSHRGRAR